jgi:hypothetical protein
MLKHTVRQRTLTAGPFLARCQLPAHLEAAPTLQTAIQWASAKNLRIKQGMQTAALSILSACYRNGDAARSQLSRLALPPSVQIRRFMKRSLRR